MTYGIPGERVPVLVKIQPQSIKMYSVCITDNMYDVSVVAV